MKINEEKEEGEGSESDGENKSQLVCLDCVCANSPIDTDRGNEQLRCRARLAWRYEKVKDS